MYEKIKKTIASFIEQLPMEATIGNCESAVFATNMHFMGGNGGHCKNDEYQKCHNATSGGDCINSNGACPKSRNKGSCTNTAGPIGGISPTDPQG